jgi:hypothetical protein
MANVNVFADRQINRRTGQKLYAPDLSIQGHKKRQTLDPILTVNSWESMIWSGGYATF